MGISQYYQLIYKQEIEGERIINYVRLFLSLLFPLLILVLVANNNFQISKGNRIALMGTALAAVYSIVLFYFLRPNYYKSVIRFISPFVESLLITVIILSAAYDVHASYGSMFLSNAYGAYFLFTTLSVLRLSFTASVYSGFVSMTGYLFVILMGLKENVFGEVYRTFLDGQLREIRFSLDSEGIKAFFILISGVVSGYGSLRHKRLLLSSVRKTLSVERTNRNLEKVVAERTHQLRKKQEELEKDLDLARIIQSNLLPYQLDPHIQAEVNYLYLPYFKVGGDFFDIRHLGNGNFSILICDVSGHGVGSALIASMARALYEQLVHEVPEPAKLFSLMNEQLYRRLSGNFLTMFYAYFLSQEKKVIYSSAGHPPQYRISNEGNIQKLKSKGPCIGLLKNPTFEEAELSYGSKDRFFFYTDGVVEVRHPNKKEIFGEERLLFHLFHTRNFTGKETLEKLMQLLTQFAEGKNFEDDLTAFTLDLGTSTSLQIVYHEELPNLTTF